MVEINLVDVWIYVGSFMISVITIILIVFSYKHFKHKNKGSKKEKLESALKELEESLKKDKEVEQLKMKEAKMQAEMLVKKKKVEKKAKVEIVEDVEPDKPYDYLKSRSRWKLRYWRDMLRERMHPEKTILVDMELLNGFHREFLVKEKDGGFRYRKNKYIFDNESKYYKIDSKLWCFDYHENFTLPIKRKIPISDIKKTLEHSNISEVEYATNPSTLERFIVARIAEGIMKGQQIDEFLKQIRLIIIITMVTVIAHLLIFMFKSGIFQQVKIPGIN